MQIRLFSRIFSTENCYNFTEVSMSNLLMDKNNEKKVYENILFEKDVYRSACQYLKSFKKIMIITSPTPKLKYLQFFANTLNEHNINFYVTTINKAQVCNLDTILSLCAKSQGCEFLVAFGAGKVADITKLISKQLSLPFCVIPTTISHYGLFNNISYLLDDIPTSIKCNYPQKVFIDLDIIKKSPENFILSSISFAVSLVEKLFTLQVNRYILGECNINTSLLIKKIKKIEELLNWVSLSKDFALLNLMDYIIDLNEICRDNYESNSITYSLAFSSSTFKNNFGEKCLISSTILLNLYSVLFSLKRIGVQGVPNQEKIVKNLSKRGKNESFFEKYIKETLPLTSDKVILSLNQSKNELTHKLDEQKKFLSKFAKKITLIKENPLRAVDQNEIFTSLSILPFIQKNYLLNILCRYGLLNVS